MTTDRTFHYIPVHSLLGVIEGSGRRLFPDLLVLLVDALLLFGFDVLHQLLHHHSSWLCRMYRRRSKRPARLVSRAT